MTCWKEFISYPNRVFIVFGIARDDLNKQISLVWLVAHVFAIYIDWNCHHRTVVTFSGGWGGDPYFRDLLTIVKVIGYSIGGSLLSELYSQWDKLLTTRLTLVFRPTLPSSSGSSKRYYFEHLQLNSTQLKLSVSSAGRLPEDLQSLKSSLGLILVNLEDATVDLGRCTNLDDRKIL